MTRLVDFPIAIIDEDYNSDAAAGVVIRRLAGELEERGHRVIGGISYEDALLTSKLYTGIGGALISIDGSEAKRSSQIDQLLRITQMAKARNPEVPIYLFGERRSLEVLPVELLNRIRGYLYLYEDTSEFMARHISNSIKEHLENLLPPFFKGLVEYTAAAKYSWHTPGHGGGVAFMKSPVGQAFHHFFGENTLRSDLSISVPELGSLLDHTGPIKDAEAEAAATFNADMTFFVTNGTSAANKIVWHGVVGPGDLVIVDRNCHKSLVHVITMIGAIPIYFKPSRNGYGIIGPISLDQFSKAAIDKMIADSPLAKHSTGKVRLAVITNSTYDGLCYNADIVKKQLDGLVEFLHFDEAWYAYARFHEFYAGRYGMSDSSGPVGPTVFATQSTHKLLAAFSQASMIHVKEGKKHKVHQERFNESFMMHTSTSPHYGIIASCDVSARMMRGSAGRTLVQETLDEAISFRRAMSRIAADFAEKKTWWFRVWEPDRFDYQPSEFSTDPNIYGLYRHKSEDWELRPNVAWHGFGEIEPGFALLDPIKVTLLSPGIQADGSLEEVGIPAAVITKFLWSRGIVVEKTGLYNFLVLFSMGITKGKWGDLVTELLAFKRLYDANAPLSEALPSIANANPGAYAGMGLRDLCQRQHEDYRKHNTAKIQNDIYTVLPHQAMTPQAAYNKMIHGEVEEVSLDALPGRVSATMVVPYPPGIPLIMAGEQFTKETQAIIDYLKFCQDWDSRFPGFESDVHGVRIEVDKDGRRHYRLDCVK